VLVRLAHDPEPEVRYEAIRNYQTPQDTVEAATLDVTPGVRTATTRTLRTPSPTVWKRWADDQFHQVRAEAARRTDCPSGILTVLARDMHSEVLESVAQNPGTSEELLQQLIDRVRTTGTNNSTSIRERRVLKLAALHPACTPSTLELLAEHRNPDIRNAAALNRSLPASSINQLVRRGNLDDKAAVKLAGRPDCPARALQKLREHTDPGVRARVAKHQSSPPELLDQLSHDISSVVRANVAGNPNTPRESLEKLIRDKDSRVQSALARNPAAKSMVAMRQLVYGT
jgi:hypothetical protein